MREHIMVKWGWDEAFQRKHHQLRWNAKPWQIVEVGDEPVGTVTIHWLPTHLQFGEFYLSSAVRNRGLGTQVLKQVLAQADARRLECRLEYLKWNPVASLYARHGFHVVAENDIHFFAVRPPDAA
jgi:RimJ/RimL family protein N-acetyltransferase